MSERLHVGSFAPPVPAVQREEACSEQRVGKKHEMGHRLQGPVTVIYKWLTVCIFKADASVTHCVTVSNELHLPLHFYFVDTISFTPICFIDGFSLVLLPVTWVPGGFLPK